MPKRTLSGGEVSADIRAGLGYNELMLKYGLSTAQLDMVFKQLSAAGYINEAEVPAMNIRRDVKPPSEPVFTRDIAVRQEAIPERPFLDASENENAKKNKITRILSYDLGALMNKLLRQLGDTDQPLYKYLWRAWLISIIPTLLIWLIVDTLLELVDYTSPPLELDGLAIDAIVLAPWIETLIMAPILRLLKQFTAKTLRLAVASAIIWGILHGLYDIGQGLTITWSFFVLSLCFLEWEKKKSQLSAIGVTALVHTLHNLVGCALILCSLSPGEDPAHNTPPPPTSSPVHNQVCVAKDKEAPETVPTAPAQRSRQPDDPKAAERHKSFRLAFPDFGMDEFELANGDLYPDWKRSVSRDGTWEEFLLVYGDFVKWYEDKGSPREPGFKLWRAFLDSPGTRPED